MKSAFAFITAALFNTLLANPTPFFNPPNANLPPFFHITPVHFPVPSPPPPPPLPPAPVPTPVPAPVPPPLPLQPTDKFQIYDPVAPANCCTRSPSQNMAIVCPAGNVCQDFDYIVGPDGLLYSVSLNQVVAFSVDNRGLFINSIGLSAPLNLNAPMTTPPFHIDYKMTVQNNNLALISFMGQTACFIDAGGPIAIGLGDLCIQHQGSITMPIKFAV